MKIKSSLKQNAEWIDISVCIKSAMAHWPGDQNVKIEKVKNIGKGDMFNLSRLLIGSHNGTHMDAPLHFFKKGKSLDKMPLDAVVGTARVIEIKDRKSIKLAELKSHKILKGERILFKTANSGKCWKARKFCKTFVHISIEAAAFLAKIGVRTVGIDYLSVGGYYKDGVETHRVLLGAGIWIIEGLNLTSIKPGNDYDLICLPLKILNSDGAPARAIIRVR